MSDLNKEVLLQEFRQFISEMKLFSFTYVAPAIKSDEVEEPNDFVMTPHSLEPSSKFYIRRIVNTAWWYNPRTIFNDFNKEVIPSGKEIGLEDGVTIVRSDDDFWIEARFPYQFHLLTIQDIVAVVWPDVKDPSFGPDAANV